MHMGETGLGFCPVSGLGTTGVLLTGALKHAGECVTDELRLLNTAFCGTRSCCR
jgi:hypothetical protein